MLTVVKVTERDGVTPKDGDIGDLLSETGVTKRNGLVMMYPIDAGNLLNVPYMILCSNDDGDDEYSIRTSRILDVYVNCDGQTVVTTRNTIYFLEEV